MGNVVIARISGGGQSSLSSLTAIDTGMPVYLAAKTSIAKDFCASGNLNSSCPEFFLQLCGCAGKKAFTLAEVLITLGIIGVVAAMTLPGLVQNYQKKLQPPVLKQLIHR